MPTHTILQHRSLFVSYSETECILKVIKGTSDVSGIRYSSASPTCYLPQNKDVLIRSDDQCEIELIGDRIHFWLTESFSVLPPFRRAVYCVVSQHSDLALTCFNGQQAPSSWMDLNFQTNIFLPLYIVGGRSCQFYHSSGDLSSSMLKAMGESIQQQVAQGFSVVLNCQTSVFKHLSLISLQSLLKQLLVDYVLLEDNDKLYFQLHQLRFPCLKLKWPQIEDKPQLKSSNFDLLSLAIQGVFRCYHLPPAACLPIGSRRRLKKGACYLEMLDMTSIEAGVYGITDQLPEWVHFKPVVTRGMVYAVSSLIRVGRGGKTFYLAGRCCYDKGSPVYLVSSEAADLVPEII